MALGRTLVIYQTVISCELRKTSFHKKSALGVPSSLPKRKSHKEVRGFKVASKLQYISLIRSGPPRALGGFDVRGRKRICKEEERECSDRPVAASNRRCSSSLRYGGDVKMDALIVLISEREGSCSDRM
ncbi:hypothetical protein Fmac_016739 [Flemingia macrophylla]|uniref:Uncharacterized protein n=1 Tax=Flemingia macrophylla TaxID=520843 RepID=A0ABD1MIB2_9FABA